MQLTDGRWRHRSSGSPQRRGGCRHARVAFAVETLALGDTLAPFGERTAPSGRRSDLGAAIAAVRDRHAGRPLAAVVLISDGVDTSSGGTSGVRLPPVFALAAGAADPPPDREVLAVDVGDAVLTDSVVELSATLSARGFRGEPVEVRVIENGRAVHVRRVGPPADGSAVTERFRVSPTSTSERSTTSRSPPRRRADHRHNRQSVGAAAGAGAARCCSSRRAGLRAQLLKRAWRSIAPGGRLVVRKGRDERVAKPTTCRRRGTRGPLTGGSRRRVKRFRYDAIVSQRREAAVASELELVRDFVRRRAAGC